MTAYQLLSVLGLLQLSTTGVGASPVRNCAEQEPCLDFRVTQLASARCGLGGSCEFEACIDFTLGGDCIKTTTERLSHRCDQSDDTPEVCPRTDDMGDDVWDTLELKDVPKHGTVDTQCQTGSPGEELLFLYKDGPGCRKGLPPGTDEFGTQLSFSEGDALVSCRSRGANEDTCTGDGAGNVECIWTVKLPDTCDDSNSPTCPTDMSNDFSVTAELNANAFCRAFESSVFDLSFGGFPAGAVQVVATIFDESNTEIADGSTTFDDPSQDLETQANLVPGDEGQDYTVSLVVTLSNGVVCDAVVLDLLPDCTCASNSECPPGEICCTNRDKCDAYNPDPTASSACGDPHMTGFLEQKFDFTGEDGGWYSLIADANMHINMRVTSPVPDLPEITYITGLSVLTADADGFDHSIVIETKDPHSLASSCPAGVSPCLADGSLRVLLDGEETLLAPGTVALGSDVEVSAVNLPGACRSFGFEKYWERKQQEYASNGRRLGERLSMGEWILADPTATNMAECVEYVARAELEEGGLFAHQSEHASFQIATPTATVRLSHGRLHQIAMRDPTDHYDLPDHLTWQMNMAVDHTDVSRDAKGILGETFVPTRDARGKPIMTGMAAIRGTQEDYRVDGALRTDFIQDAHTS